MNTNIWPPVPKSAAWRLSHTVNKRVPFICEVDHAYQVALQSMKKNFVTQVNNQ